MTDAIIIGCDNQKINEAFARLIERCEGRGMEPALHDIGQALKTSTENRFVTSTSPDGNPWSPLKEGTVLARIHRMLYEYNDYTNLRTRNEGRIPLRHTRRPRSRVG